MRRLDTDIFNDFIPNSMLKVTRGEFTELSMPEQEEQVRNMLAGLGYRARQGGSYYTSTGRMGVEFTVRGTTFSFAWSPETGDWALENFDTGESYGEGNGLDDAARVREVISSVKTADRSNQMRPQDINILNELVPDSQVKTAG